MKIGELAILANCTTETVRFYEKAGLLPKADRTQGNYRDYGPEHLKRLRFIRNCRALDMTHEEIRALLTTIDAPGDGCGSVVSLIDEHIGHVETRIQELQLLKDQLADLRRQCHAEATGETCGILRGLETMHPDPAGDRHTHLG